MEQPHFYQRIFWNSATVRGCVVPVHYAEHIPKHRARLLELYYSGKLRPFVDRTVFSGIESVAAAVEYQLQGRNCGKLIVRL